MDKPTRILPPIYFLASLLLMTSLHFFFPLAHIFQPPYSYAGGLLIVAGIVVVVWGARLFQRVGTAIKPFEQSSALVTDGPYRYSRNPMYLGMVVVMIGIGLVFGSASPFVVVPVFIWLIQRRFILPEEGALARTFGSVYTDYKRRVRRWL